jgi:hypothetical protein
MRYISALVLGISFLCVTRLAARAQTTAHTPRCPQALTPTTNFEVNQRASVLSTVLLNNRFNDSLTICRGGSMGMRAEPGASPE